MIDKIEQQAKRRYNQLYAYQYETIERMMRTTISAESLKAYRKMSYTQKIKCLDTIAIKMDI